MWGLQGPHYFLRLVFFVFPQDVSPRGDGPGVQVPSRPLPAHLSLPRPTAPSGGCSWREEPCSEPQACLVAVLWSSWASASPTSS